MTIGAAGDLSAFDRLKDLRRKMAKHLQADVVESLSERLVKHYKGSSKKCSKVKQAGYCLVFAATIVNRRNLCRVTTV